MARVAHLRVALLAVALTLSLGACGSSSKKTGAGSAITIQGFAFSPNPLSAKAGEFTVERVAGLYLQDFQALFAS